MKSDIYTTFSHYGAVVVYADSKVHGANRWAPDGPHVVPIDLAIRVGGKLHSTELAALEFTDRISQEKDAKKIPFSIFLDLS